MKQKYLIFIITLITFTISSMQSPAYCEKLDSDDHCLGLARRGNPAALLVIAQRHLDNKDYEQTWEWLSLYKIRAFERVLQEVRVHKKHQQIFFWNKQSVEYIFEEEKEICNINVVVALREFVTKNTYNSKLLKLDSTLSKDEKITIFEQTLSDTEIDNGCKKFIEQIIND